MPDPLWSPDLLAALAEPTRLRALALLRTHGELCVCELTAALNLSQPKLSRHLARLRHDGITLTRRDGQWVHYRINAELPAWAHSLLDAAVAGLTPQYQEDAERLARNEARLPLCCPGDSNTPAPVAEQNSAN